MVVEKPGGPCCGPGCGVRISHNQWWTGKHAFTGKACCHRSGCKKALHVLPCAECMLCQEEQRTKQNARSAEAAVALGDMAAAVSPRRHGTAAPLPANAPREQAQMAVPVGPQQAGGWFGGWFGGPTVEAGGATTAARGAAPTMPAGGATATAAAGGEATAAGAATTEAGGAMEGALSMEEELRAAASCPRAPTTASEENITLIAAEKIVGFQILEQTYYLVRGKFVPEADADFDYDDKASNPTTEHWMTKADFIDKIEAGHQFEEQRWS